MSRMILKFGGKVAVITGAGSGIGAATAKLFTQLGASITITGTTKSKLETTIKECEEVNVGQPKPLMIVGNIRDNDVRKKIIDDTLTTFGKLDILVNNAGAYRQIAILDEGSIAAYDELLDINLSGEMFPPSAARGRSVIVLTQLAAPHLIKTKGSIINNSSAAGKTATYGSSFYSISKRALDHFTKHAARELGPHQVRVNSVSPGMINTSIFTTFGWTPAKAAQFLTFGAKLHVLGRIGESPEVAQAIAFLVSDDASFITGTDIPVDGGALVNPIAPPVPNKLC